MDVSHSCTGLLSQHLRMFELLSAAIYRQP
jgi:hypothetical protein